LLQNRSKSPQFRWSSIQTALEKSVPSNPEASFLALFSGGHKHSPVSATPSGECSAITNRQCGGGALTSQARGEWHFSHNGFVGQFSVGRQSWSRLSITR
jgi:hypothetical protein